MKKSNTKYIIYFFILFIYVFYTVYTRDKVLIVSFVLFSYSLYYLLATLFSIKKTFPNYKNYNGESEEPIAILMATCDDFDYEAADSLLIQDYKNYHIFICDDSKEEVNIDKVKNWANNNSPNCTRLYRNSNRGFKAGNLNDSEKKIPKEYTLFCVLDSDQIIPKNYLSQLYNEYISNRKPAFIQGIHIGRIQNNGKFSKVLSGVIYPEWRYHLLYKNNYGLPTILGHGYLIERLALTKAKGHPEIVSEDLALTMNLASILKFGIMSAEIVSKEIYPKSFNSIQSRRFRWTMADWEILFSTCFRNFLKSKIPFIYKIDIFLREIRLPLSTIFGFFTLIYSILILNSITYSLVEFNPIIVILLLLSMSPLYAVVFLNDTYKQGNIAFLSSLFIGLSMLSIQTAAGITYFIEGKATFYVTNKNFHENPKIFGPRGILAFLIDCSFLIIFLITSIIIKDYILLSVSLVIFIRILSSKNIIKTENYIILLSFFLIVLMIAQFVFYRKISLIGFLIILSIPLLVV